MWIAENIFVIGICKKLSNADDLKKSLRYPSNGSFTVIRLPHIFGATIRFKYKTSVIVLRVSFRSGPKKRS
jgi:hypothetical protein